MTGLLSNSAMPANSWGVCFFGLLCITGADTGEWCTATGRDGAMNDFVYGL
jgi:hypothetical protein